MPRTGPRTGRSTGHGSDSNRAARPYDSSRRKAAAAERRRQVVGAATRLFAEHGWTGTTLPRVAAEAGVSTELIAGAFRGKAGLLLAAVSTTLAEGDLAGARAALHLEEIEDLGERRAVAVGFVVRTLRSMAPLLPTMIQAATEGGTALELFESGRRQRLEMAEDLVRLLARPGAKPLPDAAELIYLCTSGEVYLQLTVELGWDEDRYAAWLRAELDRLVGG